MVVSGLRIASTTPKEAAYEAATTQIDGDRDPNVCRVN
jgi:hypothetical protein